MIYDGGNLFAIASTQRLQKLSAKTDDGSVDVSATMHIIFSNLSEFDPDVLVTSILVGNSDALNGMAKLYLPNKVLLTPSTFRPYGHVQKQTNSLERSFSIGLTTPSATLTMSALKTHRSPRRTTTMRKSVFQRETLFSIPTGFQLVTSTSQTADSQMRKMYTSTIQNDTFSASKREEMTTLELPTKQMSTFIPQVMHKSSMTPAQLSISTSQSINPTTVSSTIAVQAGSLGSKSTQPKSTPIYSTQTKELPTFTGELLTSTGLSTTQTPTAVRLSDLSSGTVKHRSLPTRSTYSTVTTTSMVRQTTFVKRGKRTRKPNIDRKQWTTSCLVGECSQQLSATTLLDGLRKGRQKRNMFAMTTALDSVTMSDDDATTLGIPMTDITSSDNDANYVTRQKTKPFNDSSDLNYESEKLNFASTLRQIVTRTSRDSIRNTEQMPLTNYLSNQARHGSDTQLTESAYIIIGPILFVYANNQRSDDVVDWQANIEFRDPSYRAVRGGSLLLCGLSPLEGRHLQGDTLLSWFSAPCMLTDVVNDTVTCSCNSSTAFVAVFYQPLHRDISPFSPGGPHINEKKNVPTISEFLGFKYIAELYVAGQVLRAISLLCLLLTIATYTFFRKTRKGIPTRILLNLCVSLVALLVVLYLAEELGGTRMGCRVANCLRYYLVMVSLLWNGVEGRNMHRMLITVFPTPISWFVLKAGCIAWGLPTIAAGIALAVDVHAFDGTFLNCTFRCSLRKNMLYYGYMLPMSVIIVHNLVVFALVIRVLCKPKPTVKTSVHSYYRQLCGAFTMLALLGIPWMFSAFAVIDVTSNKQLETLEAVFDVIFVVCINLQGLFIFGFHCVRNETVREHWKSAVFARTISTYTTSATSPAAAVVQDIPLKLNRITAIGSPAKQNIPRMIQDL